MTSTVSAEVLRTRQASLFIPLALSLLLWVAGAGTAAGATPCEAATHPSQCGWFSSATLPPFVQDAITSKGGVAGPGQVLVLTSGDPQDPDTEISNDLGQDGCGTNPDGWQTYDCNLLDDFVPPEDSVVLALSSEWFEWYQTIYTDWMTISAGGVPVVDVSINSWINSKVDVLPYGPMETGVVLLTSLAKSKMVNFRVADSGDHIYDTALVVVPATWFGAVSGSDQDETLLCGNGKLDPGEECDDDNTITDDGCSSICLGTQPPPSTPPASTTCGNLVYAWPNGTTAPYTCGADLCGGYRCVVGNTISPACFTSEQCAAACTGTCVDIETAQFDCSTLCEVQPPANEPPPVLPEACSYLVYAWPDGATLAYTCDDPCAGQRCVTGTTISPACYTAGECNDACDGECVDIGTITCTELCDLADQVVAELSSPCDPAVDTEVRPAANQQGRCFGNFEICKSTGTWEVADGGWEPEDEMCNGLDDDCNGIADDMFETCGDPGLCQNTVNTCDPSNPAVPVECVTLPPPSEFEICGDGLDNDCDGEADDGCECGDDECMPGETFATCSDCPPPPNGSACDDGNFCTLGDQYLGGTCVSGTTVNTCADDNACTTDETCNPSSGCSATKVDCDDHDTCTVDSCDPATGCSHEPDPACAPQDADGDGFPSLAAGGTDCDDDNAAIHPGAAELCNGTDDDCDAAVDEGFDVGAACLSAANDCGTSASGVRVCAPDGLSAPCNATTPDNPAGFGEPCSSPANACGDSNTGTGQCDGTCSAQTPAAADADGDGTPDCLDQCPQDENKTAPGLCGCGRPETTGTFYPDADADGFGAGSGAVQACAAPAGYVTDHTDCNDAAASVHPGAAEICNGVDDDCSGAAEEGVDADHDGVNDCGADLCRLTRADGKYVPRLPLLALAPNRWELRKVGTAFVWGTTPKSSTSFQPTIAGTHGCSCRQILDRLMPEAKGNLKAQLNLAMQYLFGCTRTTLEQWAD